jgi:predicted amidohydrolase YtcJ
MTLAGAYAGFEENEKGSIEVGKLADLTVLSQDLMTVEAERILDTVVSWTMVNGEVVYSRNAAKAP